LLKLSPEDAERVASELSYDERGLVAAVAQDAETRQVLMVAFMNREAVVKTLTTGFAHYWSRSRKRLWMKGESSGNVQEVVDFFVDCDKDSVLLIVKQRGAACHKGAFSCFHVRASDFLASGKGASEGLASRRANGLESADPSLAPSR